jgi:hypothetical protein
MQGIVIISAAMIGASFGYVIGAIMTVGKQSDDDEAPEPIRRSKIISLRGKGSRKPNSVFLRQIPVPPGERDERSQHPHPQSDSSPQRASGGNVPSFNVRGKNVIS